MPETSIPQPDHPIGAHLVHRLRNHPTDFFITPGAHGGHLTNGIAGDGLAPLAESSHDLCSGLLHASAEFHRTRSSSGVAQTFPDHGLSQGIRSRVKGLGQLIPQAADALEQL